MKISFLVLLTFIPAILLAQQTKKIIDKEGHETFYVLKSDKLTKHGEYKKFSYNDKLIIKGFYKQGVKDSIWECYDFDGTLTLKYDYTKNEVVFHTPGKMEKHKIYRLINNNTQDTLLSRHPIYLGGDGLILSEVNKNTRYPSKARENGISGKVYVLFTVDKFGKSGNHHVDNPLGYGIDEEAIRVIKLLPDMWLPGLQNGEPVDVEVSFPINFSLK